jgi:hypothetical protein
MLLNGKWVCIVRSITWVALRQKFVHEQMLECIFVWLRNSRPVWSGIFDGSFVARFGNIITKNTYFSNCFYFILFSVFLMQS